MVMSAGSVLKSKVQGKLRRILPHVYVLQGYGMTELCGAITLQLPNHKNGSCGTIAKNMEMKIVDPEAGKVLGPNHSGEIWIKSIVMMTGYYRNPEATKDAVDEEGWLHSGDIGYIDEDGELFITDRIKELIKYKGYQVSPAEIEGVLITHPAVLEAAVIGVPHTIDDEHPLAYITKKPGAKVTEQELIDFVAKNMMDNCKLRGGVIFLDSFPYTGSGKISKKNLKAMTIVN